MNHTDHTQMIPCDPGQKVLIINTPSLDTSPTRDANGNYFLLVVGATGAAPGTRTPVAPVTILHRPPERVSCFEYVFPKGNQHANS